MQFLRSKSWWLFRAQSEPEIPISAGVGGGTFALEYRPTIAERFWCKAGFRYHLQDLPDDAPSDGWAMTHVRLNVLFSDRLRLLLSGKLRLDVRQGFNTPVDTVVSATSIQILRPGAQW